jgi:hypothetical protein
MILTHEERLGNADRDIICQLRDGVGGVAWMSVEGEEELNYCLQNRIRTEANLYTKEAVLEDSDT